MSVPGYVKIATDVMQSGTAPSANLVNGGVVYAEGERVRVIYLGKSYTGVVIGYYKTPSGDNALGVQLDVDVGLEVKYFLSKNDPLILAY